MTKPMKSAAALTLAVSILLRQARRCPDADCRGAGVGSTHAGTDAYARTDSRTGTDA